MCIHAIVVLEDILGKNGGREELKKRIWDV